MINWSAHPAQMQINAHERLEQRNETAWNGMRSIARTSTKEKYEMNSVVVLFQLFLLLLLSLLFLCILKVFFDLSLL